MLLYAPGTLLRFQRFPRPQEDVKDLRDERASVRFNKVLRRRKRSVRGGDNYYLDPENPKRLKARRE
jgi:hypothetical protein